MTHDSAKLDSFQQRVIFPPYEMSLKIIMFQNSKTTSLGSLTSLFCSSVKSLSLLKGLPPAQGEVCWRGSSREQEHLARGLASTAQETDDPLIIAMAESISYEPHLMIKVCS